MTEPVLDIVDLRIAFAGVAGAHPAVDGVSLRIEAGQALGLVGESGSGKSLTAAACLGLVPSTARVSGSVTVCGMPAIGDAASLRRIRGSVAAMVFQNPMVALNPYLTIERQLTDIIRSKQGLSPSEASRLAAFELARVRLPSPEAQLRKYPHQLSGGQLQRVMIAAALACKPALLIADEPTTALDVTVQAEILALLKELRKEEKLALLYISHDLGTVADLCDRIAVMEDGCIVESGATLSVLASPQHTRTQALLDNLPVLDIKPTEELTDRESPDGTLVRVKGACKRYDGAHGPVTALDNVDLTIERGRSVAIVGESGSGKTTLAMSILGLVPLCGGRIEIEGTDLDTVSRHELRQIRSRIGVVFQNPYSSLNPRMPVLKIVAEPLCAQGRLPRDQQYAAAGELLHLVGIDESAHWRRPNHFSGGQRQRIAIARALILKPQLLILDEPTAALDVSLQSRILKLLQDLRAAMELSFLLITHNITIVDDIADDLLVMQHGRVVEEGAVGRVLAQPAQPYTHRLLDAIPQMPQGAM